MTAHTLSFNEDFQARTSTTNTKLCSNVTLNLREFDKIFETIMMKPAQDIVELLLIK